MSKDKKVNVIKASYDLQKKVGQGPIDDATIKFSQTLIDSNGVDFGPLALLILQRLKDALDQAGNAGVSFDDLKELFIKPVMELKANAAIFHYDLVGELAAIMLGFLENIKIMDSDAIEIVRAHHTSLHMIVTRKLTGDGGEAGKALVNELKHACDRYYLKKFGK